MKHDCIYHLTQAGISVEHAVRLRKDAMMLHRWHELECGIDNGCVERDEATGKTYWLNSFTGKRSPIADRETPALKRIAKIVASYEGLGYYVQGDPRGAALYILRPDDVPAGSEVDSCYNRGIAVYQ
jgi:hypothetical protein